jgi:hypothetical protein
MDHDRPMTKAQFPERAPLSNTNEVNCDVAASAYGDSTAISRLPSDSANCASVGQTCAPNEISQLHSVFATDARSSFGAEVKMTDASSRQLKLTADDATASTKDKKFMPAVFATSAD